MYRSILVPIDGTAFGEHALALAATIAGRTGATLHLAHVHVPMVAPVGMEVVASAGPWNDILKEQEGGYLQALANRLANTFGTRVRYQVMDGPVSEALEEYARQCGADLLVMSTHGHSGMWRVWHHCLADQIVRELPVPVLLVHPADAEREADLSAPRELHHVLIPLDGSATPYAMLEEAVKLGRGFRARYTLLRVVPPATAPGRTAPDNQFGRRSLERDQLAAHQYLNAFAERLRAAGVDVRTEVRVASVPAEAIVRFVRDSRRGTAAVDIVAMERRPHRGLGHALATHTTDAVVRDAQVPVLVVQGTMPSPPLARAEPLAVTM
jgi:nucleotide-binding universal stress UspA family protein